MSTLEKVNGEALSVPGLRFWGQRKHGRVALIASDERGAVELWTREGGLSDHGGIELHSPRPLYGENTPDFTDCDILPGQLCWTDGSSLAWPRTFVPLIRANDSAGVLRKIAEWHASHFGGAS